jgi:HSP20 family protein
MERLRREMNDVFSRYTTEPRLQTPASYPAMNVWTNENGAAITAELPGVEPEDIEISVVNDTLTLTGSRRPDELKEGERYHRRERGAGQFTRTFQLPFRIEEEQVEAQFKHGVLHISVPRAEADKPKKIAIKTA